MITCYILDDEQNAVDALSAMLRKKFPGQVEICGSGIHPVKAIEEIEQSQPDVLFLDVEMPEMNGLDLLRHFPSRNFHVIFTTAHEKYALPALKAAATDYLVKPISPQDLFEALQKCFARKREATQLVPGTPKISLPAAGGLVLVHQSDIIFVEADNNYSRFYFSNRSPLLISKTLGEYEKLLPARQFFRVHQSYLINLSHIESVSSTDGDMIILTGGHKALLSRRRKAAFLQLIRS